MAPTNDFLPFCPTDTGTNLLSEADYAASSDRTSGNKPGIASAKLVNKAIRQATYIAGQIAQFLSDHTGDNVLDDATPSELQATMAKVWPTPTGTLLPFAGSTGSVPVGYLLADGASVLRATYPALFAVIGTTYGSVDGTHFTLPNTKGVFLRGAGSQTISGKTFTGTQGTSNKDSTAKNGLAITSTSMSYNPASGADGGSPYNVPGSSGAGGSAQTAPNVSINVTLGVGDTETAPANISVNYIIKT